MPSLKPLVILNGLKQQLPSGYTLDATITGGEGAILTNDEAGSIVIGTPVYMDAASGVKKAKANALATSKVVGLVKDTTIATTAQGVIHTDGIMSATTGQWDAVCGTTGGLTFGTLYFLDPATAGLMTTTAPSTVGQYVRPVMIGISATEGRFLDAQDIVGL